MSADDAMPGAVGAVKVFACHGKHFSVKRCDRHTWFLRQDGVARGRFGTREQIAEDVSYVLAYGVMPRSVGVSWA